MQPQILTFKADKQNLTKTSGLDKFVSGTRGYIKAKFELSGSWANYELVLAIWSKDGQTVSSELDSEGRCSVPDELVQTRGKVKVNLVEAVRQQDKITYRLTTYPIVALDIVEVVPTGD